MPANHYRSLLEMAKKIRVHAHAPYSCFQVGAAIISENGTIYTGCNVENASYGLTICAEGTAIGQMISAGAKRIQELLVIADTETPCMPCGACRQRIAEFADPNTIIHCCNLSGDHAKFTLEALLPKAFEAACFFSE